MTLKIFAHFTARCYAERCIATASRPSVTLRYRGHIGWNSSKIISWLICLLCSLSADTNITDLLQREHSLKLHTVCQR